MMDCCVAVPSTPRGNNGRTLGIPPSLPGLSFGPENLLILIGELLLHKIDLDAASDDRLLMCTTAAAAGIASASSTTASSREASRPATAASRPSTASANAGSSGGGGGAGGLAAAAAAGALLGALPDDEGQDGAGPLMGGSAAAVAAWWSTRFRKDLEGGVFEYFMTRCDTLPVQRLRQQCTWVLRRFVSCLAAVMTIPVAAGCAVLQDRHTAAV